MRGKQRAAHLRWVLVKKKRDGTVNRFDLAKRFWEGERCKEWWCWFWELREKTESHGYMTKRWARG